MKQQSLFEPLEPIQKTIRLDEIAPWSNDGARSPIKVSIQLLGMIDPVTVQELPPGNQHRYKVRAGKRRLSNCCDLGIETVPAVILPAGMGEVEGALVPLVENILRRDNPLHEAREIQSFFDSCRAAGMPEGEIKPYLTGLGFPASVINQRLKLLSLPPEIQQGITEGTVKPTVAAKVANRSRQDQQVYVQHLTETGKLTGKDVIRLCQLILGEVALSYNGMASSCVFMDFSSYGERQLGPEAKAAGQVATAQLCWRTGSSVTEQIRDLGMGKEKALSA